MSANDFRKVQNKCRLQNGLAVNSEGRSGGLVLMWKTKRMDEGSLIKEKLDRFFTSISVVENFPFIATRVVDDKEARNVIERAWNREGTDYDDKIERVRSTLSPWQCKKYGKINSEMRKLEKQIEVVIDSSSRKESGKRLKETHRRLDFLYAREESYWAQSSRSRWLREEDLNTRYFHAKATGRLKKNNIEKLKDAEGNWVTDSKGISKVAKDYFVRLFRSNGQNDNIQEMGYLKECVTRETNERLNIVYTVKMLIPK
ncbi:hypothetical protein GOBAR_DD00943 [Gossypium barbadense]|nr:hypothetical protein GOBAR_DD00943 [Gossypium barbadense]